MLCIYAAEDHRRAVAVGPSDSKRLSAAGKHPGAHCFYCLM
jgi:hypothetical protein